MFLYTITVSSVSALVASLCSSIGEKKKYIIKIFFYCWSAEDSGFLNILSEIFLGITTTNRWIFKVPCVLKEILQETSRTKQKSECQLLFSCTCLQCCLCFIHVNVWYQTMQFIICFSVSVIIRKWVIDLKMLQKFPRGSRPLSRPVLIHMNYSVLPGTPCLEGRLCGKQQKKSATSNAVSPLKASAG